jgi:glycosyltransferase involved in cell wall biosynthesis
MLFRFPAMHGKIERLLDYGQYLNRAQLKKMGIFDDSLYLSRYNDVAFSGCNPYVHYMLFGWRENREISSHFSENDLKTVLKINTQNPIYILRGLAPAKLDEKLKSIKNKPITIFSIPTNEQTVLNKGVNLIGYFSSEIGLGQAVRNLGTAIDAAAISCSFIDSPLPQRSNDIEYQTKYSLTQKHHANIVVCGINAAGDFYKKCEPGRVNYLYPFWELSEIPLELKKELLSYEGFFAPSQFIADALQRAFNQDIPLIRQPVRSNFKYVKKASNDSILKIIAFFDFDSYVARKNPYAVLEAFLLAFPKTVDSVLLTVKIRGHNDHGARALLAKYANSDKRIIVIDKTLTRADMDQLIASSDVYISMHRSEGFGFGPAEALAMGKVVVSTDYSGTKDFINHDNGFPVAYELVEVKKNEYPFSQNQRWANPSIEDAAKHLQEIHTNFEMAQLRGLKGLAFMQQHYSPQAVSKSLKDVLQQYGLI